MTRDRFNFPYTTAQKIMSITDKGLALRMIDAIVDFMLDNKAPELTSNEIALFKELLPEVLAMNGGKHGKR